MLEISKHFHDRDITITINEDIVWVGFRIYISQGLLPKSLNLLITDDQNDIEMIPRVETPPPKYNLNPETPGSLSCHLHPPPPNYAEALKLSNWL